MLFDPPLLEPGHDPASFARLLRNELPAPRRLESSRVSRLGLASPERCGRHPSCLLDAREVLRTPERGLFRYKSQPEEMESTLLSASTGLETPMKAS